MAPQLGDSGLFRLNDGVSIFTAELYAIQAALEYINASNHTIKQFLILSDSRSALQALLYEGRNRMQIVAHIKTLYLQLVKNSYKISFAWVPSHTGICGNELADRAAGQAARLTNITTDLGLSLSEAQAALKAKSNQKWREVFSAHALIKGYVDPQTTASVNTKLPTPQHRVLLRLRSEMLRGCLLNPCVCFEPLDFEHLINCAALRDFLPKTLEMLGQTRMNFNKQNLLSPSPSHGWEVVKQFLHEIMISPVGEFL